jgi:expansin (peptidoglycan-binding protein)
LVFAEAFKPNLRANDGLGATLARFFVKLDGAKQVAEVGNSDRRLPVSHGQLDDIINAIGSVNDGELGVQA